MAIVEFKNKNIDEEIQIRIGDYVYCEDIDNGTSSFWGIVNNDGDIVGLDDGETLEVDLNYISLNDIIGELWKITKHIPNDKVKITIEKTK